MGAELRINSGKNDTNRSSQYKVLRIQRKYKNQENSRKGEVKSIKSTPLISPRPIINNVHFLSS